VLIKGEVCGLESGRGWVAVGWLDRGDQGGSNGVKIVIGSGGLAKWQSV
jgi:hypothetical protein